jgi:hypothetical protein
MAVHPAPTQQVRQIIDLLEKPPKGGFFMR